MSTVHRSGVRLRHWSKKEYYRLAELGFFRGQRVELIEGKLMVQSPQNPLHAAGVYRVTKVLEQIFQQGYIVRAQFPIDLGQTTEPEPDVAVVLGTNQQYTVAHPTSAVLLVEVSDTTLGYDRRRKGSLYARAGIADYWIINLRRLQLEVSRAPVPDSTQRYGHRYSSRTNLRPGSSVSPLILPNVALAVADLLT
jgi:Uma2 family endonuclease